VFAVVMQAARGFLMGMADIVPGVSGGTVALVLGIYRRLLANVRTGARALKALVGADLAGFRLRLAQIEWLFLLPLLGGIVAAFLLLRHPMEDLLRDRPQGVAAVFSGLVAASIYLVWRSIDRHDLIRYATLMGVAVAIFALLGLQASAAAEPPLWAFVVTGAVAICAMILPGISGSFIMLMLGMYAAVLAGSPVQLVVFALGAVVGLALFSSLLGWLLEHHDQTVMAALVGLMLGSFRVLWPWPNGVGFISDDQTETVRGTAMTWPGWGDFAGGVALALAAFAATFAIVKVAEARTDDDLVGEPVAHG
jgi:putative membrane protein